MALFQVDGWDLKQSKVAVGGKKQSKRSKKLEKALKGEVKALQKSRDNKATSEGLDQDESNEAEPKDSRTKENKEKSEDVKKAGKKRKHEESTSTTVEPTPRSLPSNLTPLQKKMMAKLSGSRFRWINEQLYTTTSDAALKLIEDQPQLFDEYHEGFRSQVQSWPENPVDVFVEQIKIRATTKAINAPGGMPGFPDRKIVIADMGCGEAQLALDINKMVEQYNKANSSKKYKAVRNSGPRTLDIDVHSFDLKKHNERITVADIKNVPLPDGSCTVVIFCLALMGTNFIDFINEAYRLLAPRGELWIAEIKSRFSESSSSVKSSNPEDVGTDFVDTLKLCGFFHKKTDNDNKMFTRFEFFKPPPDILAERKAKLERRKKFVEHESEREELEKKRAEQPEGEWLLKPCIYKRR